MIQILRFSKDYEKFKQFFLRRKNQNNCQNYLQHKILHSM